VARSNLRVLRVLRGAALWTGAGAVVLSSGGMLRVLSVLRVLTVLVMLMGLMS